MVYLKLKLCYIYSDPTIQQEKFREENIGYFISSSKIDFSITIKCCFEVQQSADFDYNSTAKDRETMFLYLCKFLVCVCGGGGVGRRRVDLTNKMKMPIRLQVNEECILILPVKTRIIESINNIMNT